MYDNIYAGNVPIVVGEAGDIDTPIDWDKPFPEFGNNINDVALRTAGLGDVKFQNPDGTLTDIDPRTISKVPIGFGDKLRSVLITELHKNKIYKFKSLPVSSMRLKRSMRLKGLGEVPSTDTTQGYTVETNFFEDIWNAFSGQTLAPSINSIEAKIQAEVAQFLGLKNTIIILQNDSKVVTTDRVTLQQLYNSQVSLEQSLQGNLGLINEIKLGNRSAVDLVTDITSLSIFATQMEMQIGDVNSIASKYGYSTTGGGFTLGIGTIVIVGIIGYIGYTTYKGK